jgi:hypothetical protein
MPDSITATARWLASALGTADISAMDTPALDALDKLFRAVTHDRREALAERRRVLWQDSAVFVPADAAWSRTEIISLNAWPEAPVARAALIRRTDTGQHFIVSTNREETLVWRSDADGEPYPNPDPRMAGYRETTLYPIEGRGLTRADAIGQVNAADGDKLAPGLVEYPSYDD